MLMETCPAPAPWERQQGETTKAFAAFAYYRDLGPVRSLDAVARRLRAEQGGGRAEDERGTGSGRRPRTRRIEEWSRTWRWRARAEAWDEALDRLKREAAQEAAVSMGERHAAVACLFQAKVVERIQVFTEEDVNALAPRELALWFEAAVRVERQARGLPVGTVQARRPGTETPCEDEGLPAIVRSRATLDELEE